MQEWEEREWDRREAREAGRKEGRILNLKNIIRKKLNKGKTAEVIAEELEETVEEIEKYIKEIEAEDLAED